MQSLFLFPETAGRLWKLLATAMAFLSVMTVVSATTVTITDHTPAALVPNSAWVSIQVSVAGVTIDPNTDIPQHLTVTALGSSIEGQTTSDIYVDCSLPLAFTLFDYSSDVTIKVDVDGSYDCFVLSYAEISAVVARMRQLSSDPPVTEANFDQDVYFEAVTIPVVLPSGLSANDISWSGADPISGTSWAKRSTDNTTGRPYVCAGLGNVSHSCQVWMVKITINEVTMKGDGNFAELGLDPQDINSCATTYTAPHWTTGVNFDTGLNRHPVQYHAGTKFKADAKFTVEPSDYPNDVTVKADGTDSVGQRTGAPATGLLSLSDFESDANLPPTSGIDPVNPQWKFKVGQSSYSSAGTTDHEIYRTLVSPVTRYRTIAWIACDNGLADDEDPGAAFTGIWNYFAGKAVTRWNGTLLYYYYPDEPWLSAAGDIEGLLNTGHGTCVAWASLFAEAQSVHGMATTFKTMQPVSPKLVANKLLYFQAVSLWTTSTSAQGGSTNHGPYNFHQAVEYAGQIYDISVGGGPYATSAAWINAAFSSAKYGQLLQGGGPLELDPDTIFTIYPSDLPIYDVITVTP